MSTASIIKFASKSFTLPNTCVRLRSVLDDPMSDIEDMAKVMSTDPSLCAKVLKLANSALFRFRSEISSVPKALNIIGGEAAYNISMAETANLAFKSFESSHIEFDTFWQASVQNGVLAKAIAQQKQMRGSERFFVLGILQNLSELVCATRLPEKYAMYKKLSKGNFPLLVQKDIFGFTFAECSGFILETWQIPDSLSAPLTQLNLNDIATQSLDSNILYITQAMLFLKKGEALSKDANINQNALQELGLCDDDYDMLYKYALSDSQKLATTLQ